MRKAELVFIPWPGMGHLVSPVQLAKLLVDLHPNLSITLIIIKSPTDPKVTPYVDSLAANTTTSRIKFIVLPQPETDKDVSSAKLMSPFLRPLVKEVVTNIVQLSESVPDSPKLAGFVLDMFFTSFVDLANEFGVPSYVFFASGAAFLGFVFYIQALFDEQKIDIQKLRESDVGPILNLESATEIDQDYDTIMEWLDKQPPSSVVFLCFGSNGSFGVDQVIEIARALEQSGHRFLWSLRRAPDAANGTTTSPIDYDSVEEVLPEGFLDRTAEIGKSLDGRRKWRFWAIHRSEGSCLIVDGIQR
ncbi:hypothetical protein PTKIN_Ptkin12aG0009800 [Pterospermum kingtungense]